MQRDETVYYVQEQVRRAGGSPDVLFTADALQAIHTATDGIPRLVNQLCDHALMLAALGGHRQLGPGGIEEAWADLQQLPVPWHEPAQASAAGGGGGMLAAPAANQVIEFGQLVDEPGKSVVAGTIGPSLGDAAIASIDTIGQSLQSLDAPEGDAADFSPAADSGTEVELIFHEAHDPFGSPWEEEEVVIDRYASLEDAALRNRERTTSDEGRAISAAVSAVLPPQPLVVVAAPSAEELAESEAPQTVAAVAAFDPASDPLLPEEPAAERSLEVNRSARDRGPRATISLRSIAEDDRDIILVEEEEPARPAPTRPRRQEYRQLFSSLRNKA
jgi:hypothetical protein